MADEITLTLKMAVLKGALAHTENPGAISVTLSGTNATGGVQNISTTAEALTMGDVSSPGYAYFRNTGTTNFVELGTGTGGSFVGFAKLKAGEAAVVRLTTAAPTARANTAAVDLQYFILAD
jgi:hypothetical protein